MKEKKIKARALVEIEWESEDLKEVPSKKEFEALLKDWVMTWLNPTRVKIKESEISENEASPAGWEVEDGTEETG